MQTIGTLPAGDYYVGDPCYVFPDDAEWKAFIGALEVAEGEEHEAVVFEFKGHKCFVSPTNTGDGLYRDQHGNEYSVDAGMIGAIPAGLCGGGFQFEKEFKVAVTPGRWNKRGKRIRIGNLSIKT